jgi:pSer/pThr/pTyr-binding forkhead associated (FHA) protein
MAKLYLKFEQAVLKEYELKDGVSMTIGRLPDNNIHIDNLAVSGHHARVVWEGDHFVLEDDNSLNGTFVNNRRISRAALKDGDLILIGKHSLAYQGESQPSAEPLPADTPSAPVPQMDATMVLDTRKAKEMLAQESAAHGIAAAIVPPKERTGQLQVIDGKTDQKHYILSGKMCVIGKSEMASIKLKGWFAPKVAAVINKKDNKYLIAASEKNAKVKINSEEIFGPKELGEGDVVEVAKVKLTFSYAD